MTTHPRPSFDPPPFTTPSTSGFVYVGLRVDPPAHLPLVRRSQRRAEAFARCRAECDRLRRREDFVAGTVHEAVLIPPVPDSPRFDVMVLVETTTPEAAAEVAGSAEVLAMGGELVMVATNVRRTGNVERPRSGDFLFNHFTGRDADRALAAFDDVAGWFTDRAGVRDSSLLLPAGEAPYAFVNHVRLPTGPRRFLLRLARPGFRRHVAARLRADGIENAPVLCRVV